MRAASLLAAAGLALVPVPAAACRLALLLALDVSASVDSMEYALQRDGLAAALLAPEVQAAFMESPHPVALAAFEWSGRWNQQIVLDWTTIHTTDDLRQAAATVSAAERSEDEFPTAIGYALGHAARLFREAPVCDRRTLDVSGDGENNEGFAPALAYRNFPLDWVTVNGLAIGGSVELDGLVDYFRREVIRGPGAFVETAADYADYARAMRRKLLRELAPPIVIGAAR